MNFILANRERSINGLPIEMAPVVEELEGADNLEGYIDIVLMQMNKDA